MHHIFFNLMFIKGVEIFINWFFLYMQIFFLYNVRERAGPDWRAQGGTVVASQTPWWRRFRRGPVPPGPRCMITDGDLGRRDRLPWWAWQGSNSVQAIWRWLCEAIPWSGWKVRTCKASVWVRTWACISAQAIWRWLEWMGWLPGTVAHANPSWIQRVGETSARKGWDCLRAAKCLVFQLRETRVTRFDK